MTMRKKCLYCYQPLDISETQEYHSECCERFFGIKIAPELEYSFEDIHRLAETVINKRISVPGVQPKLSLSLLEDVLKKNNRRRLTIVGALGGNYILKPPSENYIEMPANEHATMKLAEAFGIKTVPNSLIKLKSGELAYITQRIDRSEHGLKIHMLDMFQVLDAVDKYKSSMERIGKAISQYASNTLLDQMRFFELSVFSFLTGNNDMHLKNFSLILNGGLWEFSAAYDLLNASIINPEDNEEMAITLNGKKRKITAVDFEQFGKALLLNKKQIQHVFDAFFKMKPNAKNILNKSFLSKNTRDQYWNLMESRYKRLE